MRYSISVIVVFYGGIVSAQVPGSIRDSAVPPTNPLDPNGDGFITSTGLPFSGPADETQFELPFIPFQQYQNDPASDNQYAAGCELYELVNNTSAGADAGYYYYKDPDGTPGNGDELIFFRFRVARYSPGTTGFSILLDTDYRFGFTGPEADPNAVAGNPGFEKEIALFNNTGATGGVRVFNVDGTATATIVNFQAPISSHYQLSNALNNDPMCTPEVPVFVDIYVPFSALGIASTAQVRMAVATNEDAASSLGGGASDIGGVDGNVLPDDDDQFITLITNVSPILVNNPGNKAPIGSNVSINVAENSPIGTVVCTASANDLNGDPLTYSITGGNAGSAFAINASTGAIQVNNPSALNFETTTYISLIVRVSDGSLYDNIIVTVLLTDVNESPSLSDASASVDESAGNGTLVLTLAATDPDAGSALSYSIVSGNAGNGFAINSSTGQLMVNSTLDFESTNSFSLVIRTSDGSLADDATITVNINDINEVPAALAQNVQLDENTLTDVLLTTVVANDPDAGSVLQYAIVGGNTGSAFKVDASTGQIRVDNAQAVDFETTPSFTLNVRVSDGLLYGDAIITVQIVDINEPPSLQDAAAYVDENSPDGAVVCTIAGSDPDTGSTLGYSITFGNEGGLFSIDGAGKILLATSALDFESADTFALTIEVTDGSLVDAATLLINVNDVNERPSIQGGSVQINENAVFASPVFTVAANDPDAGAVLQYSIVGGNSGEAFTIDASLGTVSVNNTGALDFETFALFDLTVRVSDGDLFAETLLTIGLADINEPPTVQDASVDVEALLADNDILYTVNASDPDSGDVLIFSLENPGVDPLFSVHPNTGAIHIMDVTRLIGQPTTAELVVTAKDRDGLSGSGTVHLNVRFRRERSDVRPRKGFSPNGDGENDFWVVEGIEAFPENIIQIFNRWGIMVYQVSGYDNTKRIWTGERNGASANIESTYFYVISLPEYEPLSGYVITKP